MTVPRQAAPRLRSLALPELVPCDWALLLFVLTAVLGAWLAYDRTAALNKLGLIALGVVLYLAVSRVPEHIRLTQSFILAPLPAVLLGTTALFVAYFVLTLDWGAALGKLSALHYSLQGAVQLEEGARAQSVYPNAAGGVLAACLPLVVIATSQVASRRSALIGIALVVLVLGGLLLSATRGSWLALLLVALECSVWLVVHRAAASKPAIARQAWWLVGISHLALLVIAAFILLDTPFGQWILNSRPDRLDVWHNSLNLVADYPVTGLGLGGFGIAYSSYAMLVPVGFLSHAHNLFLDVWLEQGLLGIAAFVSLAVVALRSKSSAHAWRIAGIASLATILLHGLVDDSFYGYTGSVLPLMFIPIGLLARRPPLQVQQRNFPIIALGTSVVVALGIALVIAVVPSVRSVMFENVGALIQTQVELSRYQWPAMPVQDIVRRNANGALGYAISQYEQAIALDPGNASANRRLGQIELSLGQYDDACLRLKAAYIADPLNRATRQLFGECYSLVGDVYHAVQLWQTIDLGEGQLQARQWWYGNYLGDQERTRLLNQAISALKGT